MSYLTGHFNRALKLVLQEGSVCDNKIAVQIIVGESLGLQSDEKFDHVLLLLNNGCYSYLIQIIKLYLKTCQRNILAVCNHRGSVD